MDEDGEIGSNKPNESTQDNVHIPHEEEEEDWSQYIQSSGDNNFTGSSFARHDCEQEFQVDGTGTVLKIASVSALSPIDMVNLSWGKNDATGHRIWLGAQLFLGAIPTLKRYFDGKCVLELGAGTGIGGIAVDKALTVKRIVLTDASHSVLELCRQNCRSNCVSERVTVEALCWGEVLTTSSDDEDEGKSPMIFDTMIAADVLYDLKMWPLILKTAKLSLKDDGIFILSHCPRAAVPEEDAQKGCTIEDILIHQAKTFGFGNFFTIPPSNLTSLPVGDQQCMQEVGAAIFVFKKL